MTTIPDISSVRQGDLALLSTERAQGLLASNIYARVAYVALDGTPRVFPIWFHWDGEAMTFGTVGGSAKVTALRKNPAIAVTIDTQDPPNPPGILQLRGTVTVTDEDDVFPEWFSAARKYLGDDAAEQWRAAYRASTASWARITLRPAWAGLLDFSGSRLPAASPLR